MFWADAWRMFCAYPITGVGLGAFPTAYPSFGRSSAQNERLETVHNDYLQLLTDAGLVGVILLVWFLYEVLRHLRQAQQRWIALRSNDRAACLAGWLAVLGIAVHSVWDFNLQITANALLCQCLLALAVTSSSHSSPRVVGTQNFASLPQSRETIIETQNLASLP